MPERSGFSTSTGRTDLCPNPARSAYREPIMPEVFDVTPTDESPGDAEETASGSGLPSPVDHLVDVATHHQIVMLGDRRGVAQHLAVLADAIGPLHRSGVANLAWEFTNTRRQETLDELTTADEWDRRRAVELFVDLLGIGHGYEDYLAVIEAIWRHNTNRPDDWPPFRLIALGLPTYVEDPELLDGRSAGETALRNWWMGGHYRDVAAWHMANTVTAEVLRKGERAVVYCDTAKSNTRLVEWIDGQVAIGPGNLLHNWMGEGIARVVFHGAIDDDEGLDRIEQLVAASPDPETSFGLDLTASTLGNVRLHGLVGSQGVAERSFDLVDVADGYLFVAPRAHWTPAELIADLLTPATVIDAEKKYRALDPRDTPYSAEELEEIRTQGRAALADEWPQDPTPPEPEPDSKRRRFRRS